MDAAPAMLVEPLTPQLIYTEDFSQPKYTWFEGDANGDPNYNLKLASGGYYFTIGGRGTWITYQMEGDFPVQCRAMLQAALVNGSPNDVFALLVRYQDDNNYLGLVVNGAGIYDFLRCVDGETTSLAGPAYSSELRTGSGSNQLEIICRGERFQFLVNDHYLGEITDNSFPQGLVTFAASRLGTDILKVRFEFFRIWTIP